MRKTLRLLLTICLLTLGHPLYADQIFNSYTGTISEGTQTPVNRVITPFDDGFRVAYSIPNYIIEEDEAHPGTYRFMLNEFSSFSKPGDPALPSKEDVFYVTNSESASLEIMTAVYKEYNFNIATNTYELSGEGDFGPDVVTPFDGFHAEGPITDFKGFTFHERELVKLTFNPILYNHSERKIRVYTAIIYKINYNIRGASGTLAPPNRPSMIDFDWNEISKPPYTPTEIDTKTMLIVTPDSLVPTLKRFVEWKKTLGIDTHVLTEKGLIEDPQSPIPFTYNGLKDQIQEFYSSHPQMEYLLIIGNGEMVPGYNFDDISWTTEGRPYMSDFYYSALDSYFPLFKYGRLPAANINQLDTVIGKIIRYERNPPTEYGIKKQSFYSTGVHMSYLDSNGWREDSNNRYTLHDNSPFVAVSEEIANYITKVASKKIDRLYSFRHRDPLINFPGVTHWSDKYYNGLTIPASLGLPESRNCKGFAEFRDALNKGCFYAMYLGHGELNCFYNDNCNENCDKYGPRFDVSWVNQLTNIDKLPVIFSSACTNANFGRSENLANTFLTHKEGGAIAFLGHSSPFFTGLSEYLEVALTHSIWPNDTLHTDVRGQGAKPTTFLPSNTYDKRSSNFRLGAIHLAGIEKMLQIGSNNKLVYLPFHCIGDPSMEMRTESPAIPMAIYTLTDSTLKVSAPDSECRISIYDRKNQIVQSVVGKSYEFTVEKGEKDISLCVNKSNCIPYIVEKLKITSVNPPIIIVNCESPSPNSIDVTCSVGEDESDVSLITTNLLTGETSNTPVTETGETLTRVSVSKSGNYVVGLVQRGQVIDTRKIIVK